MSMTMRSLPLQELEACRAVTAAGSFVGGARAIGVTLSAMSQIIRHLEEQVGVQLFHCTTRGVSPMTKASGC